MLTKGEIIMKLIYYFLSALTGKYKFRIYDFFVTEDKKIMFVVSPITRFVPETLCLEDLIKNQKLLDRLDPDSLRIFKKVVSQVEQSISANMI
jgi:hypothetical protein